MPPEAPSPQSTPPSTAGAWLQGLPQLAPHVDLKTLQLAWLGDAVWELHQRLLGCQAPAHPSTLHTSVVARVRAEGQAIALQQLLPLLTQEEQAIVRRGRNRAGRGPRHQEGSLYGQATGFETMVGWLFLRNPRRLAELLDHLEKTDPLRIEVNHESISE